MIQTKQNCAQIEKELLAIVYACEEFHQYIFGRNNGIVQSDQKLLETIVNKPTHSWTKSLQHMGLCLQNYDIQVEYKKGETMFLADTLSHAYLKNEPRTVTSILSENDCLLLSYNRLNLVKILSLPTHLESAKDEDLQYYSV